MANVMSCALRLLMSLASSGAADSRTKTAGSGAMTTSAESVIPTESWSWVFTAEHSVIRRVTLNFGVQRGRC